MVLVPCGESAPRNGAAGNGGGSRTLFRDAGRATTRSPPVAECGCCYLRYSLVSLLRVPLSSRSPGPQRSLLFFSTSANDCAERNLKPPGIESDRTKFLIFHLTIAAMPPSWFLLNFCRFCTPPFPPLCYSPSHCVVQQDSWSERRPAPWTIRPPGSVAV